MDIIEILSILFIYILWRINSNYLLKKLIMFFEYYLNFVKMGVKFVINFIFMFILLNKMEIKNWYIIEILLIFCRNII